MAEMTVSKPANIAEAPVPAAPGAPAASGSGVADAVGEVGAVGGKAANLILLSRLPHVTVPPFRVIDSSWFDKVLAGRTDMAAIEAMDPGPEFRAFLEGELAALRAAGMAFLSVRSSAVGEDSAEASFS